MGVSLQLTGRTCAKCRSEAQSELLRRGGGGEGANRVLCQETTVGKGTEERVTMKVREEREA